MSWSSEDKRALLAMPRLGPGVLERLEAVGIDSMQSLREIGVDEAISRVCRELRSHAWRNRRQALLLLTTATE